MADNSIELSDTINQKYKYQTKGKNLQKYNMNWEIWASKDS